MTGCLLGEPTAPITMRSSASRSRAGRFGGTGRLAIEQAELSDTTEMECPISNSVIELRMRERGRPAPGDLRLVGRDRRPGEHELARDTGALMARRTIVPGSVRPALIKQQPQPLSPSVPGKG